MAQPPLSGSVDQGEAVTRRKAKREELFEAGHNPYPAAVTPTHSLEELRAEHGELLPDTRTAELVTVAGRVMFYRSGGKIAFVTLQEGNGERIQLMLMAQELGAQALSREAGGGAPQTQEELIAAGKRSIKEFGHLVDLGDFISATGLVATSVGGELSVMVQSWAMASKGVRPLPFLHSDLSEEMRVRQPYAHLIQSPQARALVRERSLIVRTVRRAFEDWGFLEVETPLLQPLHGGALARPFKTHVNALDEEFSLRIALELNLKKLAVGGLERVFEMGVVGRNEGIDSTHNPTFTLLEAYEAYGDMYSVAGHVETLLRRVCSQVNCSCKLTLPDGETVDLKPAFAWLSVYEGLSVLLGVKLTSATSAPTLLELGETHGVKLDASWPAGKMIMELSGELLEPTLIHPTFLHDWPAEAQPLARRQDGDPRRVLAWDLILNGAELGTGFTELVDPVLQREVLTQQSLAAAGGDAEAMELDEDFLRALEYGMPPTGGLGLGIDRLVALFTGASAREVILFPMLKKEIF